jgi:hypothetical protein
MARVCVIRELRRQQGGQQHGHAAVRFDRERPLPQAPNKHAVAHAMGMRWAELGRELPQLPPCTCCADHRWRTERGSPAAAASRQLVGARPSLGRAAEARAAIPVGNAGRAAVCVRAPAMPSELWALVASFCGHASLGAFQGTCCTLNTLCRAHDWVWAAACRAVWSASQQVEAAGTGRGGWRLQCARQVAMRAALERSVALESARAAAAEQVAVAQTAFDGARAAVAALCPEALASDLRTARPITRLHALVAEGLLLFFGAGSNRQHLQQQVQRERNTPLLWHTFLSTGLRGMPAMCAAENFRFAARIEGIAPQLANIVQDASFCQHRAAQHSTVFEELLAILTTAHEVVCAKAQASSISRGDAVMPGMHVCVAVQQ